MMIYRLFSIIVFMTYLPYTQANSLDSLTQLKVYSSNKTDFANVEIKTQFAIQKLMGEPVVVCRAKWKIIDATVDGKKYYPDTLPEKTLRKIALFSLNLIYQIKAGSDFIAFECDPGVLDKSGKNKWSFTVPGSPNWNSLIRTDISNTFNMALQQQFSLKKNKSNRQYAGVEYAKETFKSLFSPGESISYGDGWLLSWAVERAEVNLWPIRSLSINKQFQTVKVRQKKEKQIKEQRAKAKVKAKANSASTTENDDPFSDDFFDSQITEVTDVAEYQEEIRLLNNKLSYAKNKSEELLSIVVANSSELSNSPCIKKNPNGGTLQISDILKDYAPCHKGNELKPFRSSVKNRYNYLWGYKQGETVVLEPTYCYLTKFSNGRALAKTGSCSRNTYKWVILDETFNEIKNIKTDITSAGVFSPRGYFWYTDRHSYADGIITKNGESVFKPWYSHIRWVKAVGVGIIGGYGRSNARYGGLNSVLVDEHLKVLYEIDGQILESKKEGFFEVCQWVGGGFKNVFQINKLGHKTKTYTVSHDPYDADPICDY
jgi:hypothetical protein